MIKVFDAQITNISQMIEICELNLAQNNKDKLSAEDFSKQGFLIGKLTFDDAEKFIIDSESIAKIAKDNNEILGYITGYDIKKSKINFFENIKDLEKIRHKKIYYHHQIVKKPQTKNVGSQLLQATLDEVKSKGYDYVICCIIHAPLYNEASISFHKKFGFENIGEMKAEDFTRGVYLKIL